MMHTEENKVKNSNAIVLSIDKNFLIPFEVFVSTLIRSISDTSIFHFAILYDAKETPQAIVSRYEEICIKYLPEFKLYDCNDIIPENIVWNATDHVSKATYFRLFSFSLVSDFDFLYYFDLDMLILKNIDDLFEIKIEREIAAVDHYSPKDEIRLHGETGGSYFNAGLLVFNNLLIKNNGFMEKYNKILINERERIKWHDQDVLNIAHKDEWQRLPYYFNATKSLIASIKPNPQEIKIIHYDGWDKPWKVGYSRKYSKLWLDEYHTLFNIKHPIDSNIDFLKVKIKNYLLKIIDKLVRHA